MTSCLYYLQLRSPSVPNPPVRSISRDERLICGNDGNVMIATDSRSKVPYFEVTPISFQFLVGLAEMTVL
jgi:hypothetical protein